MRHSFTCTISDTGLFKQKALTWANRFETACLLDHNNYTGYQYQSFECVIAAGKKDFISCSYGSAFAALKKFCEQKKDWLFGFLGYDLKNEIESLHSSRHDGIGFPNLFFFQPEHVITIQNDLVKIISFSSFPENIIQDILDMTAEWEQEISLPIHWQQRFSKEEYIATVKKVKRHIEIGDVYELNLCQEFFAENAFVQPVRIFAELNEKAKAPFSSFVKQDDKFLMCSSPERFLKKQGTQIISQPIKGTAPRGGNLAEDERVKHQLRNDSKERAENVMIVDLVRNDLSRSCQAGTVKLEELFEVKTFEQVHQLVSTISGELRKDVHFVDCIKDAFPMGSMTGAPKVKAMELIEQYERTKRGLYSGAVGYITPKGDFDFNVVIRSLLYNQPAEYLSYQVGSAITFHSNPEKEYEECLLKARGMREIFELALETEAVFST